MTNGSQELDAYRKVTSELKQFHPTSGSFQAGENVDVIRGDAIGEGKWNLIYYPAEELKQATPTLEGVPLVIGHGKSEQDKVGTVTDAKWNDKRKVVEFEAQIDSEDVGQMIKRGVVDSVSVGVDFEDILEQGQRTARDLEFYELALVKKPAFVDGIKEIISESLPEDEVEKLNELSGGDEMAQEMDERELAEFIASMYSDTDSADVIEAFELLGDGPEYDEREMAALLAFLYDKRTGKVLEWLQNLEGMELSDNQTRIRIPKKAYDELANKDDLSIVGVYPGPKEYYPSASGYGYPSGPSQLTLTFKEIFNRLDQLAKEVGLEFEKKYPYPKPEYPPASEEQSDELDENQKWIELQLDEERAAGIIDDLDNYVSMLVDEIGYPGPDTEIADILEDITERIEALEDEIGL